MSKKHDTKTVPIACAIIGFFGGIAFVNNWLVFNKAFPKSDEKWLLFKEDI